MSTELPNTGAGDSTTPIVENISQPKQMSEQSTAFTIFTNSLKRAKNLSEIGVSAEGGELAISEEKLLDAYRASIVLSISALDAYVRVFVLYRIKKLLKGENVIPKALKEYIKKNLFPSKDELHELVFETDFFEKIADAFNKDFEKQSFQGQRNISVYMRIAGFDDIFKKISRNANVSADNMQTDIERFTQRRHDIVHCGDHDLNQIQITENNITKEDAKKCLELVEFLAEQIHKISAEK